MMDKDVGPGPDLVRSNVQPRGLDQDGPIT